MPFYDCLAGYAMHQILTVAFYCCFFKMLLACRLCLYFPRFVYFEAVMTLSRVTLFLFLSLFYLRGLSVAVCHILSILKDFLTVSDFTSF